MAVTRRKSTMTTRMRNGAHEGVDTVADSLDSLRDRASDYMDQGRERANEFAETFEDTIHERPLMALLVAGAVGFVLGCFITRR